MQCIKCNVQINVNDAACSGCNEPIVFGIDGLGKGFKKHPPGLWLPCPNVLKQEGNDMTAIVACPKCSQKMRVPTDKGKLTIRCPNCKHSWEWPLKEMEVAGQQANVSSDRNGGTRKSEMEKAAVQRCDLLHCTLNTGHTCTVARTHVPDYAIEQAKKMLTNGRHPIELVPGGYECDVSIKKNALMATVYKRERPLATFGVASDVEASLELWMPMVAHYGLMTSQSVDSRMKSVEQVFSRPPESVPWCAVVCLLIQNGEFWLANFEQMVAWAWIEKTQSSNAK